MKFDFYVARRLVMGSDTSRRTPLGISIGVVGVALAYAIMLLSVSVVMGFKREIREKISGFEAPVTVTAVGMTGQTSDGDEEMFGVTDGMRRAIAAVAPQTTVHPVADRRILLKTDSAFAAITLRCIGADYDRSFINRNITEGTFGHADTAASDMAVSRTTADELGLHLGDRITAHRLRNGDLVSRRLTVKAIYDTHFSDYDRMIAFGNIGFSRSVQRNPADTTLYSTIEVRGLSAEEGAALHPALQSALLADHATQHAAAEEATPSSLPSVRDALQSAAIYYSWLDLLDTNVVVIIILMTCVAGFTLISCLFILILERVNMIGTLKAMGCRNRTIRGIFIIMSQRIVLRGLLWGNLIALTAIFAQHYLQLIPLDAESYYLNYVPTAIDIPVILLLNVATVVIAVLMLVLPSQIISTLSPVESMRYNDGTSR